MKRILSSICIMACLTMGASAQNFPDIPEAGTPDPLNRLIRSGILAPHRPNPWPPARNFWANEPSPASPDRKEWAIALLAGANNIKALLGKSKPHEGGWTLAQGATGRERLKIAIANLPDLKRGCSTLEKEIASMYVDIDALKRELAGLVPS